MTMFSIAISWGVKVIMAGVIVYMFWQVAQIFIEWYKGRDQPKEKPKEIPKEEIPQQPIDQSTEEPTKELIEQPKEEPFKARLICGKCGINKEVEFKDEEEAHFNAKFHKDGYCIKQIKEMK